MKVSELVDEYGFRIVSGTEGKSNVITGVYIGDLLSWVMSNAKEGDAWITIMGHVNIIAVASLTGVSCVIVAENAEIDEASIRKAESEGISLLATELSSYEVAKIFAKHKSDVF